MKNQISLSKVLEEWKDKEEFQFYLFQGVQNNENSICLGVYLEDDEDEEIESFLIDFNPSTNTFKQLRQHNTIITKVAWYKNNNYKMLTSGGYLMDSEKEGYDDSLAKTKYGYLDKLILTKNKDHFFVVGAEHIMFEFKDGKQQILEPTSTLPKNKFGDNFDCATYNHNTLLIGSRNRIIQYKDAKFTAIDFNFRNDSAICDIVCAVMLSKTNSIFFALEADEDEIGSIYKYHNNTFEKLNIEEAEDFFEPIQIKEFQDKIYVLSRERLYTIENNVILPVKELDDDYYFVEMDANNNYLTLTEEDLLHIFDGTNWQTLNFDVNTPDSPFKLT